MNWIREKLWLVATLGKIEFKVMPSPNNRFACIMIRSGDRNQLANVDSEDEGKRFCEWVARAEGIV